VLFLDKVAKTDDLRLDADALAVFTCTQDTLKVFDDSNTLSASSRMPTAAIK
jgi:hypothetical protein